jgi:hypothetical protein
MLRRLALHTLAIGLILGAAEAQGRPHGDVCRGPSVATIEARLADDGRRHALGPDMVSPFVHVWIASRRTALPAMPTRITVYARPDQPLLVAYHREGCVLALLTIERAALWELLRRRLGWVV